MAFMKQLFYILKVFSIKGYARSFDDVIIDGNLDELKFAAYYISGDKVYAVASMNMDPVVSQAAELLYSNKMPTASEIRANPSAWRKQFYQKFE
jgi:hypothetical protein